MIPRNGDPFKAYLVSRGRAPGTIRSYLHYIRQWEEWCISGGMRPVTATRADIGRWLQGQNAPANRLTALRTYYGYAVSTGLRPDDPTGARCLKMFLPLAPVTDPEMERLLAEAEVPGEDEDEGGTEEPDRPLDVAEVRRVFAQVVEALGSCFGMNASVNELIRQAALFVEVDGWATPGLLERRLRVNRHIAKALVETLRDRGTLREEPPNWLPAEAPLSRPAQRSVRKRRWNECRKDSRLFVCADCGQEYEPTGANQKRCPACRCKEGALPRIRAALTGSG